MSDGGDRSAASGEDAAMAVPVEPRDALDSRTVAQARDADADARDLAAETRDILAQRRDELVDVCAMAIAPMIA